MELTFEVTLDYGEEGSGHDPGIPSPDASDIARGIEATLEREGFPSVDVKAVQL